jgi:hypothetical protein
MNISDLWEKPITTRSYAALFISLRAEVSSVAGSSCSALIYRACLPVLGEVANLQQLRVASAARMLSTAAEQNVNKQQSSQTKKVCSLL